MEHADEIERLQPTGKRGGKWTVIGCCEYRIPPLGLLQIQELEDDVNALKNLSSNGGLPSKAQMTSVAKIVHAAISRNYPEVKQTDVEGMLDLGNFWDVLMSCLTTAGFKNVEGLDPGGAMASTGARSTPA